MLDHSTSPPRMRITQAMWDRTPPEKRIEMDGRRFSYMERVAPETPRDRERLLYEVVIVSGEDYAAAHARELPWRGHCDQCGITLQFADDPDNEPCMRCGGSMDWVRVGPTGPQLVD